MIEQIDRALGKYDQVKMKACATFENDLVMIQDKYKKSNPYAVKD